MTTFLLTWFPARTVSSLFPGEFFVRQDLVAPDPCLPWGILFDVTRRRQQQQCLPTNKTVFQFFRARNAIYNGLMSLSISPGDKILVPSFHCAALVEPIVKYGANVTFYDIRRDGTPNFADIRAKIDRKTRAAVVIHYFGFPQPIRKLQELCKNHDLYLIEDCAHVLAGQTGGTTLGTFGDISIFSLRKLLPLYDGGHLVLNNPKLQADIAFGNHSLLFSLKVAMNIFEKAINDSGSQFLKTMHRVLSLPWVMSRHLMSKNGRKPKIVSINNYGLDFDPALANLKMTALSKYLLSRLDIEAIIESRRRNYLSLLEGIRSFPGIMPFFPQLPEDVCPWVFPLVIEGRKDVHLALRANGIPAVTWGGVIHPTLRIQEFPDADFLYHHLVMLPIHQSIDDAEIRIMIEILAKVLDR